MVKGKLPVWLQLKLDRRDQPAQSPSWSPCSGCQAETGSRLGIFNALHRPHVQACELGQGFLRPLDDLTHFADESGELLKVQHARLARSAGVHCWAPSEVDTVHDEEAVDETTLKGADKTAGKDLLGVRRLPARS